MPKVQPQFSFFQVDVIYFRFSQQAKQQATFLTLPPYGSRTATTKVLPFAEMIWNLLQEMIGKNLPCIFHAFKCWVTLERMEERGMLLERRVRISKSYDVLLHDLQKFHDIIFEMVYTYHLLTMILYIWYH